MRCVLHASLYKHNCFLTLTYDESRPEYHNVFDYRDIQLFKNKLRSRIRRDDEQLFLTEPESKIDIFNVHEYGKNGKKHWHLVAFNLDFSDKKLFSRKNGIPLFTSDELADCWGKGHCTLGDVSEASAMYQAQYTQKDFKNGNVNNEKKSHSKHSGIGRPYFLKHFDQILRLGYVPFRGKKLPVPRYFQKIAHKHYCHFYDTSVFFDIPGRKALYRPFKPGQEIRALGDLYPGFIALRNHAIDDRVDIWSETVEKYLTTKDTPDFIKSAENALYDLRNRNQQEKF